MQINNVFLKATLIALLVSVSFSGCTTLDPYTNEKRVSRATIGTGIGALGGALAGQLIGHNTTSTLVGAGLGAAIGGISGNYMDRQNEQLRLQLRGSGVQIAQSGGVIRLIMPGSITFEDDRAEIRSAFFQTLNNIAVVLNEYKNTTIRVAGFASSTGDPMHNQILSEARANAVADYLIAQRVSSNRLMVVGYGARYPVASNATLTGQALNRRVEITIRQA